MKANRHLVADTVARINDVGIGIMLQRGNNHSGALYRDDDDNQIYILHLPAEGKPHRDPWNPRWGWGVPRITRQELRLVRAMCHLVFDLQDDIPYGFKYGLDTRFSSATGALTTATDCRGLSCATFVLALFHSLNIHLLAVDSWEIQPEELPGMVAIAERQPNHEAVIAELPTARFTPEQVSGACLADELPIEFEEANECGNLVVEKMSGYLDRRREGI